MEERYKLYYLTSEMDGMSPRYIGYTSLDIEKRLQYHIYDFKYKKCNSYKVNWISKVIKNGYSPIIIEIESVNNIDDIVTLERDYIERYKCLYNLTNSTNGGEVSKTFIESVKKKISNTLKNYYESNNTWNKGLTYSFSEERNSERRIKMGDKISGDNNHFYGKSHTDETKRKLRNKNQIYDYDYNLIFNLYLVENLTGVEISNKIGISDRVIRKAIRKYGLVSIKKEIYGKIKGVKVEVENIDFIKYYNKKWE